MKADDVALVLARSTFRDSLCVVDRCTWTGDEADLLVVTRNLRVVDVEIKISRADLKADRKKSKWHTAANSWGLRRVKEPVDWPANVWKHYYAMPADVWRDDLVAAISPASGVLLIHATGREQRAGWLATPQAFRVSCRRPAKPCRTVQPISPESACRIARLASLRMWDAYEREAKARAGEVAA